jgi:hypothetical protein
MRSPRTSVAPEPLPIENIGTCLLVADFVAEVGCEGRVGRPDDLLRAR